MEFLNRNAGAITALATVVLAVVTILYVALTSRLARATARQGFEATFFRLLDAHRSYARSMRLSAHPDGPVGVPALELAAAELLDRLSEAIAQNPDKYSADEELTALVGSVHSGLCEREGSELEGYFREFYWLLRFIAEAELDEASRRKYVAIVRAQLRPPEVILLLYHCIAPVGAGEFRTYVLRFSLLEGMKPPRQPARSHMRFVSRGA